MAYCSYNYFTNFLKQPLQREKKKFFSYITKYDDGNPFKIYLKLISTGLGCEFVVPLAKLVPACIFWIYSEGRHVIKWIKELIWAMDI